MTLTYAQLTTPRTKTQLRAQLISELQGIGFTRHTSYSPGALTLTGNPTAAYNLAFKIISSGNLGGGSFQYSTDGGVTWSATQTPIPSNGIFVVPSTGVSTAFANGPSGTGTAFLAGDIFYIDIQKSTLAVSAWQQGSTPLTLTGNNAAAMEDFGRLIQKIGAGGLLLLATGDWLDLLAASQYNTTRLPGVVTQGYVHLVDGGGGPYTIANNQLWALSSTGLRFNSVGSYTLPLNGSVDVLFQAESPGAIYNVGNNTIAQLVTSLPGVTVSNPVWLSGTWITQNGADIESDQLLVLRCQEKWPSLGSGATSQVFDLWAKTASPSVTRTKVQPSATIAGQIEVYLANSSGAVGAPVVTAVDNYLQPRKSLTTTVLTQSAVANNITVTATVYVSAANYIQAQADASQNLQALFNGGTSSINEILPGIDIGSTVYLSQIIEQLQVVKGVRNVVVSAPGADVILTATQVATLTQNLTFVSV